MARQSRAGTVRRIHAEAARLVEERIGPPPSTTDLPVPPEADQVFALRQEEQPVLGLDLTYRARGNEQLVYTAVQYPGVAFKVQWFDTKLILESLGVDALAHWVNGTIADVGRARLLSQALLTAERLERMRSVIGEGHSVPRGCGALEFPFPGRVLRELGFPEVIDPTTRHTLTTPIVVQEWRSLEGGLDFATGMRPPSQVSVADVTRMGQKWLERSVPPGFEPELLTRLAPDSTVPAFVDAVRNRPPLAAAARAFVDSAREYTRGTGELFALRGRNNVYFDADGTFHLIDAMGRPPWQNSIAKLEERLRRIRQTGRPAPGTAPLAPVVNSIASLNALADEVGTEPYWELPDDLKPYPWDTYVDCIDWQTDGLPHEQQPAGKRQAVAEMLRVRPAVDSRSDGLTR
ncbi:hypothetical protein [Kribbella jejuensis]|uniref:hypothetical protein n=1 Tax=Kribbella jejuensis TaxID=236068 RepID=UPI0011512AA5|nr:hypothetical protein [Kribbella jejuensis]